MNAPSPALPGQREALQSLVKLAVEVAILAPKRQSTYSVTAGIPWSLVMEIRRAAVAAGYDVPALIKAVAAERKERAAAKPAKTDPVTGATL